MARTATKFNCASNKLSRLLWTRSFSSRIESHTKVVMAAGSTTNRQNLIVVGGGAAGFMAAIEAARGSKEAGVALDVTILEASARVLQKVKISGGGRCNVLHDEQKGIKTISEGSAPRIANAVRPAHFAQLVLASDFCLSAKVSSRSKGAARRLLSFRTNADS